MHPALPRRGEGRGQGFCCRAGAAAELCSAWTGEGARPHTCRKDNQMTFVLCRISDRNSVLVSSSLRKQPSIEEVTAEECCFSTPRIIMQRWRASITTPTPCGSIVF